MDVKTLIKSRRVSGGRYEVHTPLGSYLIEDYREWTYRGRVGSPKWMLTYPGQLGPDAQFGTKKDAMQQIQDNLEWELRNTTPEELRQTNRSMHADDSPFRLHTPEESWTPGLPEGYALPERNGLGGWVK